MIACGALVALSLVAADAGAPPVRVFVASLTAGNGADPMVLTLVADAVLVEAKRHEPRFRVMSTQDVRGVLDLEAEKQAMGCDAISCATEIADALDAPQLVTGQLGRVGDSWLLTLTRTERSTLHVLARTQSQARGESPEGLLREIPAQVDLLFGAPPEPPPPLLAIGLGTAGAGVLVAGVGGALHGFALVQYETGKVARDEGRSDEVLRAKDLGEGLQVGAFVAYGAAVVVVVAGVALAATGLLVGDAP